MAVEILRAANPQREIASPLMIDQDISSLDFSTWNQGPEVAVAGYDDEGESSSYLVFEPVVESVSTRQVDWRRYEAPLELLDAQPDTPREVRDLLASSVERIKTRHAEEQARRAAAARQERPIGRSGRATARPRLENQRSEPSSSSTSQSQRSSTGSALSSSSMTPHPLEEIVPSSPLRTGFGIGALFKRHQKSSSRAAGHIRVVTISNPLPRNFVETASLRSPTGTTGECVSCLEDFKANDLIKLRCHDYCKPCFQKLISTAVESETHWPAKCCLNQIPSGDILPHLDNKMKRRFKQREEEWSVPVGDRIYCCIPTCSTWIPPKNISRQTSTARCPLCAKKTCVSCRGEPHGSDQCPQDTSLQATIRLAEIRGWKRCYKCHALVEHNKGCRHMTCRCKAQFCYICGSKWPTCSCTDAQLEAVNNGTAGQGAGRAAPNAQETAEEAEVRDAINMVAALERSEAEQRERQLEAQQRREERRIAAVSRRFQQLGAELALLHDFQRVWLAERYEFEATTHLKERQETLDVMSVRHFCELQILNAESQQINSDAQYNFEREYHVRLAEEKHVEGEYVDQLRSHWAGRPESHDRVSEARDALRSKQDQAHKIWDAHRRRELELTAAREVQKMEILVAKHESEINAVEGRCKIDELEWEKKKSAEAMWVDEVIRERLAMLQNLEQEEYSHET